MSESTFRDAINELVPGWLRGFVGSRYLYSIAIQIDALGDALTAGIKARHPQFATDEQATLIGRDRSIFRGPLEPLAGYRVRLQRWIDDWRMAGSAYSVLSQLQAYFAPNPPKVRLVNNAGAWYTIDTDGTRSQVAPQSPKNWDWDGQPSKWSRFWIILYSPSGQPFSVGPRFGDAGAVYGPNRTWGTTATVAQVTSIRSIVQTWKSAHSKCMNIIIAFDPTSFDPAASAGSPMPDGAWGRWTNYLIPTTRQARLATARYWKGF